MLNCFSIDVESFSESNVEAFPIPGRYLDRGRQNSEIQCNTEFILDLLAEHEVQATFFFLGRIARDLPGLVRRVAGEQHEIACHSFEHLRIYGMQPSAFAESLRRAKALLEDASGQQVCGFRAPDFSITRASRWALDTLREAGFIYDSSIFPFAGHDVYGIEDAPAHIHRLPNGLVEWPLSTLQLWRRRLPFGGGGYFRLYPAGWTDFCFSRLNRRGHAGMFYIHPYEAGPFIEQVRGLSAVRRFRHYYKSGCLHERLKSLLQNFRFAPAISVLHQLGFVEETNPVKEACSV
jgi:polysaccharide deacetylase family protein (PEP-CTERM system associated)